MDQYHVDFCAKIIGGFNNVIWVMTYSMSSSNEDAAIGGTPISSSHSSPEDNSLQKVATSSLVLSFVFVSDINGVVNDVNSAKVA